MSRRIDPSAEEGVKRAQGSQLGSEPSVAANPSAAEESIAKANSNQPNSEPSVTATGCVQDVRAYDVRLPEAMPTRWLNDLKASIRESRKALIITTVLSSSLLSSILTGIIATAGTYYLEARKTMLQLEMEDAKETVHLYNSLQAEANQFRYALNTSTLVFNLAAENSAMADNAGGQIDSLIEGADAIKQSAAKLNDQDTSDLVEAMLKPLTPELIRAKSNLKNKETLKNLVELCKKSRDEGIKKVLNQIDKRKRELSDKLYRL